MTARRALLLVLFAAGCAHSVPADALRILVYNVHAGKDAAGVDNLGRVARVIEETGADIVLLQEVDRGTERSGGVDQLAELRRLTGFDGAFGKSLDFQGGEYGIAILSRWPIVASEVIPLRTNPPQPRAGGSLEPRIAFAAEIEAPAGRFAIVNTHFDASRDETWRLQEAADLLAWIGAAPRMPRFVGGDFNAEPPSAVYARLTAGGLNDAWPLCGKGESLTFSAAKPVKRIDYLFLLGAGGCDSARVLDADASDHRPLLVVIRENESTDGTDGSTDGHRWKIWLAAARARPIPRIPK